MSEISSELVNVEALQRFLDAEVPGSRGSLEIEQHVAGFSNVTLFVARADQRWVLRRPPAGPLLPSAHDVLREYRFISALHGHARVPRPVLACEDDSIIGAPFYLMERVDGAVARDRIPPQYDTPRGRRRMAEEMVDALVELHAVDWEAVGLRGRPSGYLQRQLDLWTRQWELTRPHTRDLPGIDEVLRWLGGSVPNSAETTVVHGDYKLDNVVIASETGALGIGASNAAIRANTPPVLTIEGKNVRRVGVGETVTLVATVVDDSLEDAMRRQKARAAAAAASPREGPPKLSARQLNPPIRITVNKVRGLHLSWFVFRGEGDASFEPPQVKTWEDTRFGANSPWAPLWSAPTIPDEGRWEVQVSFDRPGTYVLRARADDGALYHDQDVTIIVAPVSQPQ